MTVTRHPNNQGVTLSQWRYNATGGETTLSGTDAFGAGLSYTVGAEQVFVNGVLLERGVDYTASTGTTVTGLTALVAGDIVTVSSPSAFNVANAIPKATVAAKGDLIVGNGASSVTNLAVGADGTTLVANSSASTGVSWGGPQSFNPVINSGFDIWQRGTSFSASGLYYFADRWQQNNGGTAITCSRVSATDATYLPNIQYAARIQRTASSSSTATVYLGTSLESANSIPFAGKQVTISWYARVGALFSGGSSVSLVLYSGTGTDQNINSGFTGSTAVANTGGTLSANWQRFTATGTVSSSATQLGFSFNWTPSGTAGATDYLDFTGVQIDLGPVALPYRRTGGTLQGELSLCQRYYYRMGGTAAYTMIGMGSAISTTVARCLIVNPVTMRTSPTAIDFSTLAIGDFVAGAITVTAATIDAASPSGTTINFTTAGTTTTYRPYAVFTNASTSGYLGLTAEL